MPVMPANVPEPEPEPAPPVDDVVEIVEDNGCNDEVSGGGNAYDGGKDNACFDSDEEDFIGLREAQARARKQMELGDDADDEGHGTRGLGIKPFAAVVSVAPTNAGKINKTAPSNGLSLDFVHGYRCHDSRSNLVANSRGHLVYPAAALVVTMDPDTRQQTFFTGHDDDVLCLAQSPKDPDLVATGQIATTENGRSKAPCVCIHNTVTREHWKIENAGDRAIRAIGFSGCGRYLATAGCDDKFTISVWDWTVKGGKKIASAPSAANTNILQVVWNPVNHEEFISVGSNHLTFWTFDSASGKLKSKSALTSVPKQLYLCAAYTATGNQTLVGAKDGGIYVFVRGTARKVFHVHENKVNSIAAQGKHFVTGGDDRRVCVLDAELKPVWQAEMQYQVRSVYANAYGDLIVGTRGAEIVEIPYDKQQPLGTSVSYTQLPAPIMRGHFDGEVWGLTPHPRLQQYASVGEDNQVAVWDVASKQCIAVAPLNTTKGRFPKVNKASTTSNFPINQMARAIEYSPDGTQLAIGSNEGVVYIFDSQSLELITSIDINKHGKRQVTDQTQNWIETIRYSPSGKTLAVGTHGICICLLNATANYKVEKVLTEHTAAVLAIDFSLDGTYLRSISLSYELLYHSIDEGKLANCKHQTSATLLRDTQWATVSVKFDWSTMGIWRKGDGSEEIDYSNINCVDASPSRSLIAVGTDEGLVNLFRYPAAKDSFAAKPDNGFRAHKGHSSHVMRVRFDTTEKYLYTAGGEDKCIFQWKVIKVAL